MQVLQTRADYQPEERKKKISQIVETLPITIQPTVADAFEAAFDQDYDKAMELCRKALDLEPLNNMTQVRILLGQCYFSKKEMAAAKNVFLDIIKDDEQNAQARLYLGLCHHALMEFRDAAAELRKLYPLKEYTPFYLNAYGDSLQILGDLSTACQIFREETDHYKETGSYASAEMLDGAYQHLLYLDIKLANGSYPQDLEDYYRFLEGAEMTQSMQSHLSGTISYLSGLMEYKWFRPLFGQMVDTIADKNYLTLERYAITLDSARAAIESYEYHADPEVKPIIREFLDSYYADYYAQLDDASQDQDPDEDETEKQKEKRKNRVKMMHIKALTFRWNLCRYYPQHKEELQHVAQKYPYSYRLVEAFLQEIDQNASAVEAPLLEEMYTFKKGGYSKETFKRTLETAYETLTGEATRANVIHAGDQPFKRAHAKIGRNDPCPCGSGKKYKNCCGR